MLAPTPVSSQRKCSIAALPAELFPLSRSPRRMPRSQMPPGTIQNGRSHRVAHWAPRKAAESINIAGDLFSSSLRPMLENHLAGVPESAFVGSEIVLVDTLANFIAKSFPGGVPRFALKIDTQGFEREVLDGLGSHIEQCTAVLIELPLRSLYDGAADLPTLFARLIKCNLHCAGLSPGHKNPRTGDAVQVDGLFVRDVPAKKQPTFPLFTSVPPHLSGRAIVQQREVFASWRAAGFEPISVNGPSEIVRVEALGLGVEIEPTSEDGKPCVSDIVTAIRKRGGERAGIVNADCKIHGYPDLSLKFAAALRNSVLYAERVDVGDDWLPTIGECAGFDAFFFDVGVLRPVNNRHFRLGEPWWDYWFPLQLAVNGARLGCLDMPLLHHRRHQARWNPQDWDWHARNVCSVFQQWSGQRTLMPFLSSFNGIQDLSKLDRDESVKIGAACFQWLRTRKLEHQLSLLPNEISNIEAILRDAYLTFIRIAELPAARAELAAIKASTSWRITAPLRQVVGLAGYKGRQRTANKSQKAGPH